LGNDYLDIVITPYFTDVAFPNLQEEVINHVGGGRPAPPEAFLGTILIASTGSARDQAGTAGVDVFPAAYNEVIGVIGSTPEDEVKTLGDGWNDNLTFEYEANTGAQFDVAAPGAEILGASRLLNQPTSTLNIYYKETDPSDASVAIVGGIAALMLEKDNSQRWDEIRDRIRQSAEKVTYTYNASGVSPEFAYGRVNCRDALGQVTTLEPAEWQPAFLEIRTTYEGSVIVSYQALPPSSRSLTASVIDMKGQEVALSTHSIARSAGEWHLSMPQLPAGLYSILIQDDTHRTFAVGKFLKQ
jgi:hypothetical protein